MRRPARSFRARAETLGARANDGNDDAYRIYPHCCVSVCTEGKMPKREFKRLNRRDVVVVVVDAVDRLDSQACASVWRMKAGIAFNLCDRLIKIAHIHRHALDRETSSENRCILPCPEKKHTENPSPIFPSIFRFSLETTHTENLPTTPLPILLYCVVLSFPSRSFRLV